MCTLCGLCYHLVATMHVILQATLEFYKMFYVMLCKTSLTCVALFTPVFRCFTFVFCKLHTQTLCTYECLQYFSNLCSL
jgi:hypothetical protein